MARFRLEKWHGITTQAPKGGHGRMTAAWRSISDADQGRPATVIGARSGLGFLQAGVPMERLSVLVGHSSIKGDGEVLFALGAGEAGAVGGRCEAELGTVPSPSGCVYLLTGSRGISRKGTLLVSTPLGPSQQSDGVARGCSIHAAA